jgi:hypothetical protein
MEHMGSLRRASAEALFGRLTTAQQEQLLDILTVLNEPGEECGERG